MKYQVQLYEGPEKWKLDSEYDNYENAKKRCLEIAGDDCDIESHKETKYVSPAAPYEWDGIKYINKKTGEIAKGEDVTLFNLKEGYFGKKGGENWDCRIYVKK